MMIFFCLILTDDTQENILLFWLVLLFELYELKTQLF